MAKTSSAMLPLGTQAPHFSLPDVISGKVIHFKATLRQPVVIMFICNHCPYVKHVNAELVRLARDYLPQGVSFFAINSNDTETYPDDSTENMKKVAETLQYPFPYLFDETQEVARAYQAACTPDFYVFNKDGELAYRGQLDDSRPGNNIPVTGAAIRQALDCLLAGKEVPTTQLPSLGCNIKWKSN